MFLNHLDFEMNMISSGQIGAKPFYETQSEQISKLPVSKIASAVDLENLDGIDDWYADFLKPLKRLTKEKQSNADLVYTALKRNPKQTKEEVSKATGLSRATITRTYSELEKQGRIHRLGSNKTGYWEVL